MLWGIQAVPEPSPDCAIGFDLPHEPFIGFSLWSIQLSAHCPPFWGMRGSQEGEGVRAEGRAGWCLRAQAGPVLGAASRANAQGCKCFPEPLKCVCLWTSPVGWCLGKHPGQTGTLAGAALEEAGAAPWERAWENWDAGGSRMEPARVMGVLHPSRSPQDLQHPEQLGEED